MNRVFLSAIISLLCVGAYAQNQYICRTGVSFEHSKNPNWGKGYPVITSIAAFSPASQTGMQIGDIVTSIDGVDTQNLPTEDIETLFNQPNRSEMLVTVKNIKYPNKSFLLKKECKKSTAITEEQLASSFCMYSLESNSEREFICPFKTFTTLDPVDFSRFKTFAFSAIDESNSNLERKINLSIQNNLEKEGLTVDVDNPDILIQTFYFLDKNPNYKGENKVIAEKPIIYRYNSNKGKMESVPFMSMASAETEAPYLLQFGFRLIDQKQKSGRVLWECEANELLDGTYRLEDYAEMNVPLMMMQYPYVKYSRNVPFIVTQKAFNYTGAQYDINNLSNLITVDPSSPAAKAGLQNGDLIVSINGNNIDFNSEELSAAYREFITKTMKYRDPHSQFADVNGFKRCMFWNINHYNDVANTLKKGSTRGVFSYLFYYAPYINPEGNNECVFEVQRGKNKISIPVEPSIRRSTQIELK